MHLNKPQKSWIAALLTTAALVAAACGGSATATSPPPATSMPAPAAEATSPAVEPTAHELTAEEADYIEQVRSGWNEFHSKAGGFREAFGQLYAMRSRLFEALKEAGAGSAFEGALRAVEQIDPPQRFQEDHQLMLQAMAKMVEYDHDVGEAVENQDLSAFAVANARMGETGGLMALQLSAALCPATNAPDQPFSFCSSNELLPGGQYGIQLNSAIARFNVGIVVRLSIFPPAFTPEDELATLAVIQPDRIDLFLRTLDEVQGLQPPPELTTDHLRLVRFLEEQLENNRERNSALQVQDLDKYREGGGRAIGLYCDVRQDFSPDMMQIVKVHFGDALGFCTAPATAAPTPDAEALAAIDPDELQRYLDAVGPAFQQARLDAQAVDRELIAPGPQSQPRDVSAWFARVSDNQQRLLDAVKDVGPPGGLTSIHDEFVLATSEWIALADRVVELLAEAGPEFNVGTDLAAHPELGVTPLNKLGARSEASCASIERLAADNRIDVDLGCNVIFK